MSTGQEQVDINVVLGLYRTALAEANDKIILLEARLHHRDNGLRDLPDTPHR